MSKRSWFAAGMLTCAVVLGLGIDLGLATLQVPGLVGVIGLGAAALNELIFGESDGR